MLRTICGPKIENRVYRRRYNYEFEREFDSPNVLNVTKTNRLRYAGHMIRRPEDLPQTVLFRAKPRRRNQGRPKFRWADGVNSDRGQRLEPLKTRRHGEIFFNRP
jgi:hypothetical protein